MIRRNIQERVRTIAPFLALDHDPYLVISDGRLFWIQDAYTTSSYFPYAQPAPGGRPQLHPQFSEGGRSTLQRHDRLLLVDNSDAIAATYQRIFPQMFKPLSAMPADLQRHIRYPEDLFFIQAQMYRAYHMDSPEVFYNREDLWQFPRQPEGGENATMVPYYIIMRLPGEAKAEFFLMLPMVPTQRQNMIAWLAARCDPPNYGKLIVYEFPKDKLVYGPFQIEARINQNTDDLAAAFAVEPVGIAGDPRQHARDPDRELDPLHLAALSAGRAGSAAGAQARHRSLWRSGGDEGDARRGIVGAVLGRRCRDGHNECCNGSIFRKRNDRGRPQGTRSLQPGDRALEVRGLGGLRDGAGYFARAPAADEQPGCNSELTQTRSVIMAGLVPAIRVLTTARNTWIPAQDGPWPSMAVNGLAI